MTEPRTPDDEGVEPGTDNPTEAWPSLAGSADTSAVIATGAKRAVMA